MNIARHRRLASISMALVCAAAVGCQKVPLLAPSGSTITLTSSINVLPVNGTTQLVAQLIEASGTPPHSGTHVIFTTTLGSIEPSEVETDINGRAVTTFKAGNSNGTATITASSGGATSGTGTNALKIAIGVAALGRVAVSANPSVIPALGGTSLITANVVDLNGSPLPSAPVIFTTTAGALTTALATTDSNGNAVSTLTTAAEATVTATVGFQTPPSGGGSTGGGTTTTPTSVSSAQVVVKVNPLPTVSIAAVATNGSTFTAASPIQFNVTVQQPTGSTSQIRSVTVDFGDGSVVDLGAATGQNLSVQHSFQRDGSYTVRVTAVDTLGASVSGATVVVVLPAPPLSVSLTSSQSTSGTVTTVTFTATVTPPTATIAAYNWDFGPGIPPRQTTGNQVVQTFTAGSGSRIITLRVTTTTGQTADTQIQINP